MLDTSQGFDEAIGTKYLSMRRRLWVVLDVIIDIYLDNTDVNFKPSKAFIV